MIHVTPSDYHVIPCDYHVIPCYYHVISDTPTLHANNQLLYLHEMYDILTTSDGSDLNSHCISSYSDAWKDQVITMMSAVNEALDSGLCEENAASVVAQSSAFVSLGSQVNAVFINQ